MKLLPVRWSPSASPDRRKRIHHQTTETPKFHKLDNFEPPYDADRLRSESFWRRVRKPTWYIVSGLIFLFYFWTATSSNRPFHLRDTAGEFYNQLTGSLLQGHVYLPEKPSPQLLALPDPYDPRANERFRLHDASLYRGRYYLYFGIAPAITLYVPWRLLTRTPLSDDLAVTLFSMAGYVFSCLLLFLLLEASAIRPPWFLEVAAVFALGLGQVAPILLRRPRAYEIAVTAAYCFLLGGLYFLARAILKPQTKRRYALLAALFLGLAAASRPQCAIAALVAVVFYGFYLKRARALTGRAWLADFAMLAVPLGIAGALIGWYNFVRFDNPLDFGIRYQVGVINLLKEATINSPRTRLQHILSSLYYLLLCPPYFIRRFPFFELNAAAAPLGDPSLLSNAYYLEPVASMLLISPFSFAALVLPFIPRVRKALRVEVRTMLRILIGCGLAMFAAVCSIASMSARYELDFVPALAAVGIFFCIWLSVHFESGWIRTAAAALTLSCCVWASALNVALSVNSYGYPLEQPRSSVFRSIAGFFGAGPDALMDDVQALHLDATVVFPREKPAVREPLLASGIYERWDLLFAEYQANDAVVFSYVHSAVSDVRSAPAHLSFDMPQHLLVNYSASAKRLVVRLNNESVLDVPATFYPTSRDRVTLGRMRVGRFGLRDFAGRMDVARGGLQVDLHPVTAIFTSSPPEDSVRPITELLNYDLNGLVIHCQRNIYGKQPAKPPGFPPGVFLASDSRDHFATDFQPARLSGSPPVTAVEITLIGQPYDDQYGRIKAVLQDQDYRALYLSGSLAAGQDRALVALPPDIRTIRLAFLVNEQGYVRLPTSVRLRAFTTK